jgi:hypothetical protein
VVRWPRPSRSPSWSPITEAPRHIHIGRISPMRDIYNKRYLCWRILVTIHLIQWYLSSVKHKIRRVSLHHLVNFCQHIWDFFYVSLWWMTYNEPCPILTTGWTGDWATAVRTMVLELFECEQQTLQVIEDITVNSYHTFCRFPDN